MIMKCVGHCLVLQPLLSKSHSSMISQFPWFPQDLQLCKASISKSDRKVTRWRPSALLQATHLTLWMLETNSNNWQKRKKSNKLICKQWLMWIVSHLCNTFEYTSNRLSEEAVDKLIEKGKVQTFLCVFVWRSSINVRPDRFGTLYPTTHVFRHWTSKW